MASVRTDEVQALIDQFGGSLWEENGDIPVESWAYLVANNDTRLGYWEHVANELDPGSAVRTQDVANLIARCGGSIWDTDPLIPVSDWKSEAESDDTRLGYWEYALLNRPRPWILNNPAGPGSKPRYWAGDGSHHQLWGSEEAAERFADDELDELLTNGGAPSKDQFTWICKPLANFGNNTDALSEALMAFVMRYELPAESADDLLSRADLDLTPSQKLWLQQFINQWFDASKNRK